MSHNGANFDPYNIAANLTQHEQQQTDIQLRGVSMISLQFTSNLFKASCCFLTSSFRKLCEDYEIKTKKLEDFEYNGAISTNANLYFQKPEMKFWDFMKLEETEPEYWALYTEHC